MIGLPGERRNVERIDMTGCAEHGGVVMMEVLSSRQFLRGHTNKGPGIPGPLFSPAVIRSVSSPA
jgi:hypothetical protein